MRIKIIGFLVWLAIANLSVAAQAKRTASAAGEKAGYLLVYFKDDTHSIHFAVSKDGYRFADVNGGRPVIGGDTIAVQKGIRDPYIMRGADGYFYMAMTDLHIFAKEKGYRNTQWERPTEEYDWGNNRGFVLMKSRDLLHWTHTRVNMDQQFPELNIGCAWAPELIYDPQSRKIMIYFTMRSGKGRTKLYYAYLNKNFTRLETRPEILFEYPDTSRQILDADITRLPDGRYCMMYVAQENPSGIKMAFSKYINKRYQYQPDQVDFEPRSCEAPHVYQLIGKKEWILMYDIFGIKPHNFGFARTTDFENFTNLGRFNEGVMKTDNFTSPKHGAVVTLTAKEMERLEQYYGVHQ